MAIILVFAPQSYELKTTRNHFLSSVCESRIKKYQNVSGAYRNVSNTRIVLHLNQIFWASKIRSFQISHRFPYITSFPLILFPKPNSTGGLGRKVYC